MGECTVVASANLGVLGGFSEDVVVNDPSVDDDCDRVRLRAAGRLLSSCGAILIVCVCVIQSRRRTITRPCESTTCIIRSASRTKSSIDMRSQVGRSNFEKKKEYGDQLSKKENLGVRRREEGIGFE